MTGGLLTDEEREALWEEECARCRAEGRPLPPRPPTPESYAGWMFFAGITFFIALGCYLYLLG